ncbi:22099_t:CDS:2, partial [Gigaspora rosea]
LFNWTNITLSNAPSGRDGYVSALLSNGYILYLDGFTSSQTVGLDISIASTTSESRGYFTISNNFQ